MRLVDPRLPVRRRPVAAVEPARHEVGRRPGVPAALRHRVLPDLLRRQLPERARRLVGQALLAGDPRRHHPRRGQAGTAVDPGAVSPRRHPRRGRREEERRAAVPPLHRFARNHHPPLRRLHQDPAVPLVRHGQLAARLLEQVHDRRPRLRLNALLRLEDHPAAVGVRHVRPREELGEGLPLPPGYARLGPQLLTVPDPADVVVGLGVPPRPGAGRLVPPVPELAALAVLAAVPAGMDLAQFLPDARRQPVPPGSDALLAGRPLPVRTARLPPVVTLEELRRQLTQPPAVARPRRPRLPRRERRRARPRHRHRDERRVHPRRDHARREPLRAADDRSHALQPRDVTLGRPGHEPA